MGRAIICILIVSLAMVPVVAGCGRHNGTAQKSNKVVGAVDDRSGLFGTYMADYENGAEEIVLRPDGSYKQTFTSKSGKVRINEGGWQYPIKVKDKVLLRSAITVAVDTAGIPQETGRGDWEMGIESLLGSISLKQKPDSSVAYQKVK